MPSTSRKKADKLLKESSLKRLRFHPGMYCKVIAKTGFHEEDEANAGCWLKRGDTVRVIGVYPHIVCVEKMNAVRSDGKRHRESFPLTCAGLMLKPVNM